MKSLLVAFAALTLLGGAAAAQAQDGTTVVHKEDSSGDRSKTVVKHDDGAKTVIKRHGDRVKKVHTAPNGDKTVVTKTPNP
jgi:Ni/Co efflux regulator RcnB